MINSKYYLNFCSLVRYSTKYTQKLEELVLIDNNIGFNGKEFLVSYL